MPNRAPVAAAVSCAAPCLGQSRAGCADTTEMISSRTLALKAERRACNRGSAKPRQPSSSSSGPPRNMICTNSITKDLKHTRRYYWNRRPECAPDIDSIAMAIMPSGTASATSAHRGVTSASEKPAKQPLELAASHRDREDQRRHARTRRGNRR